MKMQSSHMGTLAGTLGLMAAVAAGAPEAAAQRATTNGWTSARTTGVENVIRLADELELTGEQRDRLESTRVELLELRTGRAVRQMTLMSEIQAGIREREAVRQEMAAFAEEARETMGGVRERLQEILTEEQRDELRRLNRRGAWRAGGAWGGRGDRWGGGVWRGDGSRGAGAWRGGGGPDRQRFERARDSWRRGWADRRRGGRGDDRDRGRGRPGGS